MHWLGCHCMPDTAGRNVVLEQAYGVPQVALFAVIIVLLVQLYLCCHINCDFALIPAASQCCS